MHTTAACARDHGSAPPPRVSVVVPSLNQGAFLGAALDSLLAQDYPELELIVVDGGSRDESRALIARHAPRLAWWRSAPDDGQAQAINEGFAHATGSVLAWLCADDLLAPGALRAVAAAFADPAVEVLVGRSGVVTERGTRVPWERLRWCDERDMLLTGCTWSQPACFWRRSLWEAVGGIDASLHYTMDYDLWLRFFGAGARVRYLDRVLAYERRHRAQKTRADNYAALRREKLRVRLDAARARGYGRGALLLRALVHRRLVSLRRSTRAFLDPDSGIERWHGAALGFERGRGSGDGLRLARRWLAALCVGDEDERRLCRACWRPRP